MEKKEIIVLALLFIAAFYIWTLPIQNNSMPFGEGDGAYHFSYGDYIASQDKSMDIMGLPNYIYLWYPRDTGLGVNALQYPPSYHLAEGITQSFGGERIISSFLFIAITSFLFVFSIYFLVRELYGFWPALISGFALIFCYRSIMTYMWGQRPSLVAFSIVPLIMFSFYKYVNSVIKKNDKIIYLYLAVLLLGSVYLFHLRGLLLILPILALFLIFIWIKEKKFPFDFRKNYKHLIILSVIIALVVIPFFNIYYWGYKKNFVAGEGNTAAYERDFGFLFSWFKKADVDTGYPASFSSYKQVYGGLWAFPLLFLGLFFVFYRRNKSDLMMIAWIIAMYLNLHIDFFLGTGNWSQERQLIQESYLFYPLMAIGLIAISSVINLKEEKKSIFKGILCCIFTIMIIFTIAQPAYNLLSNAYGGVLRITPQQYAVSEWIDKNLPENAIIYDMGTLTYPKQRWMQTFSQRFFVTSPEDEIERNITSTHILLDYSDIALIGNTAEINNLQNIEKNISIGKKLVFNEYNVRIYEV